MVRKTRDSYEAEMYFDIIISITPTLKNGNIGTTITYPLKDIMIASIPIMTKSILCNLYDKSPIELHEIYEDDPTDPGCAFLISGHEYVIASIESVLYNYLHIRK